MKLRDIAPGANVLVTRGYSRRTATVQQVRPDGRVSVRFTDDAARHAASIPEGHRGYLYGAVVRPNQLTPAPAPAPAPTYGTAINGDILCRTCGGIGTGCICD